MFYDIPAYWSDAEIFELLNANVGFVEYMRTKRCYKYKTVRIKDKFHWQASKRLENDVQHDDILVIKDFVKTYHAFFGKIIRLHDIGYGLWMKKQNDFIDDKGELQEFTGRSNYQNKASRSNGFQMEWEQQSGTSTHFAPSRMHKQWRFIKRTKYNVFRLSSLD
ncbi:hypothetical protein RhiirA4_467977 [Rhizophagus irregularis]|uniref:Uncharacterized protein n=1 Tax=Rhizophagus irregularis TaxID=588596 RepID=A0A2I1GWY3_9GLOM|nr:hypothetical protein RhiirA4_467977 [Rhizophagus irregularis]